MEDKLKNKISHIALKSLDILFVNNPSGTAFGVLLGVCIWVVFDIFLPILQESTNLKLNRNIWEWMIVGATSMNGKKIFFPKKLPKEVEVGLSYIREAKLDGAQAWQIQQMHINLYNKMIENMDINDSTDKYLKQLKKRKGQKS
ncbi:hypothetical protein [Salipaludibacillus sp. CF4.18]|uniref:hypothetical protein n=1 Tax=Salipaludibacillus sp. CF4.18 TaxID=3373081 RepID=UPI003EE43DE5